MLYFSYGIRKSGSTLAFELTKALLEEMGHPQEKLNLDCFKNAKVNFLNHKTIQAYDDTLDRKINEQLENGQILAIKTHGPPSPFLTDKLNGLQYLGHANFRDPRDITLSLLDAGKKARKRGRGAFKNIDSVKTALYNIKDQLHIYESWVSLKGIETCFYNEVAFQSMEFLIRISNQLGFKQTDLPDLEKIIQRVNKKTFTQYNVGIAKRHRKQLTVDQTIYLTSYFKEELQQHLSHNIDDLDQGFLNTDLSDNQKNIQRLFKNLDESVPEFNRKKKRRNNRKGIHKPLSKFLKSIFKKNRNWVQSFVPKTKKTFVVLGCPRGGTSLIAGSLIRAGVYMGEVKTRQYEDPEFKLKPRLKDIAGAKLSPVIKNRNRSYKFWGWKVPNNVYYIDKVRKKLINPVYLFVYRDPEAIARSSAKHDRKDWETNADRLIEVARNHTEKVRIFQSKVGEQAFSFQLEEIHEDPEAFAEKLIEIVKPLKADKKAILQFINPDGGYV